MDVEDPKLRPRTLVDQAVEAIVAGAARGHILPGDRIIETEIAQSLGISRVPVREALRLLESQGLVVSVPYKGIRLMQVTRDWMDQVLEVRVALETTAARRAIALGRHLDAHVDTLTEQTEALQRMAASAPDPYRFAHGDKGFHRALCRLGGNDSLCALWETLARQLAVIIGLSTLGISMEETARQHTALVEVFRTGDAGAMYRALDEHIRIQTMDVDYERLIEERRAARGPITLAG